MPVSPHERHELYEALKSTIGDHANTFMDLLPDNLDSRFDAVDSRFDAVDARFDALTKHMDLQLTAWEANLRGYADQKASEITRTVVLAMVGMMTTSTALLMTALAYLT